MSNSLSDQQTSSLEETIGTSVMLQYDTVAKSDMQLACIVVIYDGIKSFGLDFRQRIAL